MTDVRAAAELERLPWLTDDKAPERGRERGLLLGWGIAAALVLAGSSFWLGRNSADIGGPGDAAETAQPETTVKLPQPVAVQPIVEEQPMAQVEPVVEPAPVVVPDTPEVRPAAPAEQAAGRAPARRSAARTKKTPPAKPADSATGRELWTSWESAGASGRMVRIGTYPSRLEAKRAWDKLVKVYPGIRQLRAVTTDIPSLRDGRTYYRLQFGTTSQAHSEVLCQRMRTIGQSCVVVDLAGARSRSGNDRQPIGL